MADGPYRFQQGAGHFYYAQHNQSQQSHPPRHLPPRAISPVNSGGRLAFNTDTPSPTRSPGAQSPSHNPYSMFNQTNQQQAQHVLNGGANHRFGLQMNMAKHFQHQPHQNQAHQHQQHQDHTAAAHDLARGTYAGHQHSISGGGLANAVPHFGANHLQNGTPNSGHSVLNKTTTEHWAEQQRVCQEVRNMTATHVYARNHASVNKSVISGTTNGFTKDSDKEERHRGSLAPVEDGRPKQAWTILDFSGQNLKTIALPLFNYTFLTKLYLNNNKLHIMPAQIGKLRNLVILDISLNQIKVLPPEIGMLVNLKQLLLFDNQIESLPYEMGSLYQLDMLGIEGNPLNEEMKLMVMEHGTGELIKALRETAPWPDPPEDRPTINIDETPYPPQDKLSVLSYNTLCDKAATQALYGYTPSEALSWDHRKNVILDELRDRDADIMCLQEVDSESYNEFFRPSLAHNDYKGIFWPRPRVRTMTEKEAKLVDGCATFYKNSKYILLDKQLVDISNVAINRPDMKGEHDIFNRVMPRDHIAVVAFLENRQTGTRVIVVNAHVFWDPAYTDVKVVQVAILMEQISKLAETYSKWPACTDKAIYKYTNGDSDEQRETQEETPEPGPSVEYPDKLSIPLLVCGDFNATPDSGVCELIGYGALSNTHPDLGNRKYGDFTRNGMAHPFSLKSAYTTNDLPFTNYTPGFAGMLDYIWYSTNALQVTKLLGPIDENYLQRVPGFPNYHFPSDHLALKAEFYVKGRKKTTEADFGTQSRDRRPAQA